MLICLQLERIRNEDALTGGAPNVMERLEEPTDELPREANRPPTPPRRPRRQRATELEMMMRDNPTYKEHERRPQRSKRV